MPKGSQSRPNTRFERKQLKGLAKGLAKKNIARKERDRFVGSMGPILSINSEANWRKR